MPLLILMRHAKSDWDAEFGTDHERPLAGRGINAARRMGRLFASADVAPEVMISSTAVRARSTMALVAEAASWSAEPDLDPTLYGASVNDVYDVVRRLPAEAGSAILFGHQPTFGATVSQLTGGSAVRFPTAAAAGIEVISWASIGPMQGELQWLLIPRLFSER